MDHAVGYRHKLSFVDNAIHFWLKALLNSTKLPRMDRNARPEVPSRHIGSTGVAGNISTKSADEPIPDIEQSGSSKKPIVRVGLKRITVIIHLVHKLLKWKKLALDRFAGAFGLCTG